MPHNQMERVPFTDLIAPHLELEEELVGVFRAALRSAQFVGGPQVDAFEQAFGVSVAEYEVVYQGEVGRRRAGP